LDVQSGFALANLFDPLSHTASPVLATALNMLAVVVFFALDGHHALMRGFAFSVEQVPLGSTFVVRPEAAVRQFGAMFSLGLALIAPAFVCLFIVELATSVMSRVLPQANVLVVVIPAKIFVGLAMLALSLPMLAPAMGRIYATIFRFWEEVLRHG
jgi:flagellar biosynthetic protein FliR